MAQFYRLKIDKRDTMACSILYLQVSIVHLAFRESIADYTEMQDTTAGLTHWIYRFTHNNTILGCKITVLLLAKDVV